jgi:hypothetical protein
VNPKFLQLGKKCPVHDDVNSTEKWFEDAALQLLLILTDRGDRWLASGYLLVTGTYLQLFIVSAATSHAIAFGAMTEGLLGSGAVGGITHPGVQ